MAVNDFIDFRINDFACISPEDWVWFRVEDNQRRFRRSPHVFVQPPEIINLTQNEWSSARHRAQIDQKAIGK